MQRNNSIALLSSFCLGAAIAITSNAFAHEPTAKPQTMTDSGNMATMDSMQSTNMQGMKMTGDQDYDFAMMMREHHKMALPMANKEIKEGKNAELRRMAQDIVDAQTKEIAKFDAWLSAHKPANRPGHK